MKLLSMGKLRQETRKGSDMQTQTSWHPARGTRVKGRQHEEPSGTSALHLLVPLLMQKRRYTEGLTIDPLFCPQI